MHHTKDKYWLARNPVTGFHLDLIPYGGPDNMGGLVGVVLRAGIHDETGNMHGSLGERRFISGVDDIGGWIRSVVAAQRDAEAVVAAQRDAEASVWAVTGQKEKAAEVEGVRVDLYPLPSDPPGEG